MQSKLPIISVSCALGALAAGILVADPPASIVVKEPFDQQQAHRKGGGGSTQITYHGGLVMTGAPATVYVIYYGSVDNGTQGIVNQFFTDLSTSREYAVNSTYTDAAKANVAPTFYFNPASSVYHDTGASQGTSVGNNTVPAIVQHAIQSGGLPANQGGVYFVITAPDIKVKGFCSSFCAYHTTSTSIAPGLHIRYALVPDPGQACTGCDGNYAVYSQKVTPNGNLGADEMTDSIIHELSETVTDPDLGAWYTSNGAENGDLCNYVYGSSLPTVPTGPGAGAYYNFTSSSGHFYLVQEIWSNVTPQGCRSH